MTAYAWVITHDHQKDNVFFAAKAPSNANAVGMIGPVTSDFWDAGANNEQCGEKVRKHIHKRKFKMFDDDGQLYYEGYFVDGDDPDTTGLEPLDDFGTPNAGATEIQYQDAQGQWSAI